MKLKPLIAVLAIATSMPAFAGFNTIAKSYELEPQHVNVPVAPDSMMHFSECSGCVTQSGQLTANTLYRVDGEAVEFEDFRDALYRAQESDRSGIVLQRHVKTNDIVFVRISL